MILPRFTFETTTTGESNIGVRIKERLLGHLDRPDLKTSQVELEQKKPLCDLSWLNPLLPVSYLPCLMR